MRMRGRMRCRFGPHLHVCLFLAIVCETSRTVADATTCHCAQARMVCRCFALHQVP